MDRHASALVVHDPALRIRSILIGLAAVCPLPHEGHEAPTANEWVAHFVVAMAVMRLQSHAILRIIAKEEPVKRVLASIAMVLWVGTPGLPDDGSSPQAV